MAASPELAFLEALPKAELHLHFEGSVRPGVLLELARRRRVSLPADDEAGLRRWLRFSSFDQFLRAYLLISSCLRDPEEFQLVARDIAAEQERQNVLYSELHFTISTHLANGVNGGEVADALGETLAEEERKRGVVLRLIPDIVRNVPVARADQTLEWALAHRDRGVVGLGLSGIESHPTEPFQEHFREAAREGLGRTVHAGEQEGPESIAQALSLCGAQRIGHGIRALDDPALVERLAQQRVPLEVCPSSNVALGLVPELAEHPLRRLHEAGLVVTLNSDDPPLFGTSIQREYRLAHERLGLSVGQLARMAKNAMAGAFLEESRRSELLAAQAAGAEEAARRSLERPLADLD